MAEESRPKIIPPSLRPKERYIVFEVFSEEKITYTDLASSIWNSLLTFFGELKTSQVDFRLIQNLYNDETQKGVIRVDHEYVEQMRTVLSFVQFIGESKSIIKVLGVTGTIKRAQSKYLEVLKQYE